MRRPRTKAPGEGFYHVVSRIAGKRFLLDAAEKRILLDRIRRAAAFSGVEVYTHALMDNHFHLLVRVPRKNEISDAELDRRVVALYGPAAASRIFEKWDAWARKGKDWRVADAKNRLRARMFDLSQFCKTFKETYTQDYNRRHANTGSLWEGRFKSILLEGREGALMTVAAYIHLNPVRAGTAKQAAEAPNTAFGAACAGDEASQAGLNRLTGRVFIDIDATADWATARTACQNAVEGKIGTENPKTAPSLPAAAIRHLLEKRRVGLLHGQALGSASFLSQAQSASLLPQRLRCRTSAFLDAYSPLGLTAAGGIRET